MRWMCFMFGLLAGVTGFCQSDSGRVDREQVRKLVTDSTANTYYPRLLARFNSFDTTLTTREYRLLYYGFVFQQRYSPYGDNRKGAIIKMMNEKQYAEAIKSCDSVLTEAPISMTANYYRGLSMFLMGKEKGMVDSAYKGFRNRFVGVQKAILSTGDGLACATAFKTIFVSDEYEILSRYFELDYPSQQSLVYPCDKLDVKPSAYFRASSIYFDTSETFIAMKEKVK